MANKQSSAAYAEKLKDPRWQKRRLKILERDGFACQICGSTTSTLVVHHRYYTYGKEPWDYPDEILATLCQYCHENEHATEQKGDLEKILKCRGLFNADIEKITEAFHGVEIPGAPGEFSNIIKFALLRHFKEITSAYREFCKEVYGPSA